MDHCGDIQKIACVECTDVRASFEALGGRLHPRHRFFAGLVATRRWNEPLDGHRLEPCDWQTSANTLTTKIT